MTEGLRGCLDFGFDFGIEVPFEFVRDGEEDIPATRKSIRTVRVVCGLEGVCARFYRILSVTLSLRETHLISNQFGLRSRRFINNI